MADKEYSFLFSIAANLSSQFNAAFNNASKSVSKLGAKVKANEQAMRSAEAAYKQGKISADEYNATVSKLSQETDKLIGIQQQQVKVQTSINNARNMTLQFEAGAAKAAEYTKSLMSVVQVGADFEASLSKVGAITNASTSEMAELSQTAQQLGRTTQYSASEAADAMSYLGMAGWDTQQIVAGMPGMLQLAAAGGTDLATTADIVSDNLTAFGLSAEQSAHMADVYATVITSTNTDMTMLGETMKYAAPVAAAYGASMEQTAALAGLMANAGIKASQAGTTLRAGFMRLAAPTTAANKVLADLGINLAAMPKDASKLPAILQALRTKMAGLSEEQRLSALSTIFGTEAASGWLAVINSGDGAFEALTQSLVNSDGAAKVMGDRMQDNVQGAMTKLQSAVEGVQLALATGLLPSVAAVVSSLAGFVSHAAEIAGKYPRATTVVMGLALGLGTVSFVGFKVAATITRLWGGIRLVQSGFLAAKGAIAAYNLVGKLTTVGTYALSAAHTVLNGVITVTTMVVNLLKAGFVKLFAVMMANPFVAFAAVAVGAAVMIITHWDSIKTWFVTLWDNPKLAVQQFIDMIVNSFTAVGDWLKGKWESITGIFRLPQSISGLFGGATAAATPVAHNAYGGIYKQGTFATTMAERSGESAIPHTPNRRNIGLLAKTNDIMGRPLGGGTVNATYSPQITIQGSADQSALNNALQSNFEQFKAWMAQYQREQRRISYA